MALSLLRRRVYTSVVAAFLGLGLAAAPAHEAHADGTPARRPLPAQVVSQRAPAKPVTLADMPLGKRGDVSYQASPKTWTKESIYFLMVDRFNQGKTERPENKKTQPLDPKGWHGGNINGITEKLDYIKGLGHSTIWLTPVLDNHGKDDHYHGYGIFNFADIEKRFGTKQDMKRLVTEAHKRGMRVLMDIVVNHTGRAFEYGPGVEDNFVGHQLPVDPKSRTRQIQPAELHHENNFSRKGTVNNWNDPHQVVGGDFVDGGFRHFDLSRKETQDHFIHVYKHWISETGIDGYRVDTVKHVHQPFWARFNREIKEHAASLGMHNFGTFAEHFAATPHEMARLTVPREGNFRLIDPHGDNHGFTSVLNFPKHFGEIDVFRGKAPTRQIKDAHEAVAGALTHDQLLRSASFPDNHDIPRLLGEKEGKISNLKTAIARSYFGSGIPIHYYGTEQGFRQMPGHFDPDNAGLLGRPDMFDSPFKSPGSVRGSSFNTSNPLYRLQRQYSDVRNTYEALTQGTEHERWSDPHGPGIYAFSRLHEGKEVVVIINTSNQKRSASDVWVDRSAWESHVWNGNKGKTAKLVDTLHPNYTAHVGAVADGNHYTGAKLRNVEVPAYGVRVLVSEHDYVPTPVRNFNADGHVKGWNPKTIAAAKRMQNAPSMDGAHVAAPRAGATSRATPTAHETHAPVTVGASRAAPSRSTRAIPTARMPVGARAEHPTEHHAAEPHPRAERPASNDASHASPRAPVAGKARGIGPARTSGASRSPARPRPMAESHGPAAH